MLDADTICRGKIRGQHASRPRPARVSLRQATPRLEAPAMAQRRGRYQGGDKGHPCLDGDDKSSPWANHSGSFLPPISSGTACRSVTFLASSMNLPFP